MNDSSPPSSFIPYPSAKDSGGFFEDIRKLITTARSMVVRNVNTLQVLTNFEIGHRIVEEEQKGSTRAEYGKQLLQELAEKLCDEFGAGFSERNLRNMRKFYLVYKDRLDQIRQTTSAKSLEMSQPFQLSWSQYVFLIGIKDADTRQFNSGLYERLALSRDKEGVRKLAREGQVISKPQDMLKNPYVLEFLRLDEKSR